MRIYNGLCSCKRYACSSHQMFNVKLKMQSHVKECGGMGRIRDKDGTIRYVAPPAQDDGRKVETTYIRHYPNLNLTHIRTYK